MNASTHPQLAVMRMVRAINRQISQQVKAAGVKSLATVSATSPFTVTLDGATTAVPAHFLDSYTPVVGNRVLVEIFGRQIIALGTFT